MANLGSHAAFFAANLAPPFAGFLGSHLGLRRVGNNRGSHTRDSMGTTQRIRSRRRSTRGHRPRRARFPSEILDNSSPERKCELQKLQNRSPKPIFQAASADFRIESHSPTFTPPCAAVRLDGVQDFAWLRATSLSFGLSVCATDSASDKLFEVELLSRCGNGFASGLAPHHGL
jgi:hypothetical protein